MQLIKKIHDSRKVDAAAVIDSLEAQRHGQVRLAHSRRAQEEHIRAIGDKAHAGQFRNLPLIDRRLESKVERSRVRW